MMFRPSNPYDRHATEMELQSWENDRDSKKDDFPFIHLSRKELKLLKCINKEEIEVTNNNSSAALRLRDFVFIQIYQADSQVKENVEFCKIRKRGKNYLLFLSGERQKKYEEHIHDWFIAIFTAFAGALLSRPLWETIDRVISLISKSAGL